MTLRLMKIGPVAALALLAAPQIAMAASGTVTASSLNLRACASVTCAPVAAVPAGTRVSIDGVVGGWYHVSYGGVAGYASSRYIFTGTEVTVTAGRTTRVPPEVFHTVPLPPGPPAFGYSLTPHGHIGTWYQVDEFYHDAYKVADPAILFGFSTLQ
jgi:hypothetical protein